MHHRQNRLCQTCAILAFRSRYQYLRSSGATEFQMI
nr:MAG TPA: hypothetical protein [Caudoviricetes sp.]